MFGVLICVSFFVRLHGPLRHDVLFDIKQVVTRCTAVPFSFCFVWGFLVLMLTRQSLSVLPRCFLFLSGVALFCIYCGQELNL